MVIFQLYITMMPVILAGVANMLFTKTHLYQKYNYPIDFNKKLKDNNYILGKNKTFIGFLSMMIFCLIFQVVGGIFLKIINLEYWNYFYNTNENSFVFNCMIGLLLGFAYMICELPNSFIKRRLNIESGKSGTGFLKVLFLVIDQTDSMFGVMLILSLFCDISFFQYFLFVFMGAFTHILVNFILYLCKVRKSL